VENPLIDPTRGDPPPAEDESSGSVENLLGVAVVILSTDSPLAETAGDSVDTGLIEEFGSLPSRSSLLY
jgi:hypothetical protein